MTGYQSKKAMAQDRLAQPAQEPWPEEPFGHMAGGVQPAQEPVGFVDSKLNPIQRPWVGLTKDDTFEIAERLGLADVAWLDLMVAIEAKLKEKNT